MDACNKRTHFVALAHWKFLRIHDEKHEKPGLSEMATARTVLTCPVKDNFSLKTKNSKADSHNSEAVREQTVVLSL